MADPALGTGAEELGALWREEGMREKMKGDRKKKREKG